MLNLFKRNQKLLDEEIIEWIFNCYAWAFEQFDKDVFLNETVLVIPDNKHFPGKETTAKGMASLIFDQVKSFAGMAHWPTALYDQTNANHQLSANLPIIINGELRGKNAIAQPGQRVLTPAGSNNRLTPLSGAAFSTISPVGMPLQSGTIGFSYHPQQLKKPEGIIAHFAHGLSYHLASVCKSPPPGGTDYLPMAGELTGIFMGFGIMFANSAIVARAGGCGGCGGGQAPVRQVFMNEEESTYALAVFCHLKSIQASAVTKHLKKHLRGFFKSALRDCERRLKDDECLRLVI
jgi:hypothetical protein